MRITILLALVLGGNCLAAMRAGVARIDITPPPGVQMAGYNATGRPGRGVLDPLYAQVLVIDDGRHPVALVTLDLIFVLPMPEMDQVRAKVKASAGVQDVIFVASHTHSGPLFTLVPDWSAKTAIAIVQAIEKAHASEVDVKFGTGTGTAQLGFNRRYVPLQGPATMFWRNATKVTTFPVDPTVGVIRLDRADGSPLAILVNYACHPVVLGPDNKDYSADWPGEMRKTVEAAFPGSLSYFLQGGAGDINPYYDKTPLLENAVAVMRKVGKELGDEVVRVSRSIQTKSPVQPEIAVSVVEMPFEYRYDRAQTEAMLAKVPERRAAIRYPLWGEPLRLPVTTMVLNRELAFVGMPAEPFVEFQMFLRAQSPLPNSYFLGYCNGNVNYVPTIQAAVRGGYGADTPITRVEVGAGEQMMTRGLVEIYRLLGKLNSKPEDQQ